MQGCTGVLSEELECNQKFSDDWSETNGPVSEGEGQEGDRGEAVEYSFPLFSSMPMAEEIFHLNNQHGSSHLDKFMLIILSKSSDEVSIYEIRFEKKLRLVRIRIKTIVNFRRLKCLKLFSTCSQNNITKRERHDRI